MTATSVTPLEKAISLALKKQECTATDLAIMLGMAPTNFSLARNSRRRTPLHVLLNIFALAEMSAEEQIKVLQWIAFEQQELLEQNN